MIMRRLSAANRERIPTLYDQGMTVTEVANALNTSVQVVCYHLKKRPVPYRERSLRHRTHQLNDKYFDEIDSEPKAYWLGFIAADGGICDGKLMVGLAVKDIDHLVALRNALGSTHPISQYTIQPSKTKERRGAGHTYARLSIRSKPLTDGLFRHGITPRKSHTLQFPTHLPDALVSHFLRGYMDGDGGFSITRRSNEVVFSVISNRAFLQPFQEHLMKNCRLKVTKVAIKHPETPNICYLRYGGRRQVKRIAEYLYKDATIYLPRKLERIQPFISY